MFSHRFCLILQYDCSLNSVFSTVHAIFEQLGGLHGFHFQWLWHFIEVCLLCTFPLKAFSLSEGTLQWMPWGGTCLVPSAGVHTVFNYHFFVRSFLSPKRNVRALRWMGVSDAMFFPLYCAVLAERKQCWLRLEPGLMIPRLKHCFLPEPRAPSSVFLVCGNVESSLRGVCSLLPRKPRRSPHVLMDACAHGRIVAVPVDWALLEFCKLVAWVLEGGNTLLWAPPVWHRITMLFAFFCIAYFNYRSSPRRLKIDVHWRLDV